VDRVAAATGPAVTTIGVCPGTYIFEQDIRFDGRFFNLRCISVTELDCIFDLSGFSFTSGLSTMKFEARFDGFDMRDGNGNGRASEGLSIFDDAFGRTGGAILAFAAAQAQSSLVITNCQFARNEALGGGAVAAYGNIDVDVSQVLFTQNAALTDPASTSDLQGLGGAILADDGIGTIGGPVASIGLSISMCEFNDNAALVAGGAVEFSPLGKLLDIFRSTFRNNRALNDGGALASYGARLLFQDVNFVGNSAGFAGGAMVWGPNATGNMSGSEFRGNFNAIFGRPPSSDIYRMGDDSGNLASVECGGSTNIFCDAMGNPSTVSTNFNNVTCAGAATGSCPSSRVNDAPEGGPETPAIGYNRGEPDPTIAWSWPRARISV